MIRDIDEGWTEMANELRFERDPTSVLLRRPLLIKNANKQGKLLPEIDVATIPRRVLVSPLRLRSSSSSTTSSED